MRRIALVAAAGLSGASGLALETILISSAGLALGYGRSGAIGLAVFIAAWALGARASTRSAAATGRRSAGATDRKLLLAGASVAILAWPAARAALSGGEVAAILAIAAIGAAQGAFLPLVTRAWSASVARGGFEVALLFSVNLAGCVAGAYWIGDACVGALGRSAAALIAGGLAALAGILGWIGARAVEPGREAALSAAPVPEVAASTRRGPSFASAACIVGLCTGWLAGLEWISLRLGVLELGGMQPALRSILCASLVALAAGAAILPRLLPRGPGALPATLGLCAMAGVWPVFAPRILGHPSLETAHELVRALVLAGPALLPFGAIVPVLHRALGESLGAGGLESGERLGRLLGHEAWGALLFVPLVHFALVPAFGLGGATAALQACGALAFLALLRDRAGVALVGAALCAAAGAWVGRLPAPALDTTPLRNPAFAIRSFAEDRDFAVAVVDDGIQGERTLLTDGFRAAGTGEAYRYMRVLGHLPVLLSPRPDRVAVLALGTGTTVGAVWLHPEVRRIDVLEISDAVVQAAPWFETKNQGALSGGDPRVAVLVGDGRRTLAQHPGEYDVVTMEPLLPDSPFGVYLYTREFYARVRGALAPDGLACQWVPPHALEPASFVAVLDAFARSFPWSSAWLFGTQVLLLGAEREPVLDTRRFAGAEGDLLSALRELGLSTPEGLASRFVADGARLPRAPRALTDEDPWIVYRPRRSGPALLADLPANLALLLASQGDPPESWKAAAGAGAPAAMEGIRALRRARERHARIEAALRGAEAGLDLAAATAARASGLEAAAAACPDDPEVEDLRREIAFLDHLRLGVQRLGEDRSRAAGEAALEPLLGAAQLRGERGDVHLYLAVALDRLGSPDARKALDAALLRCPRIAATPEGRRARDLGLSDDLWQRAVKVP